MIKIIHVVAVDTKHCIGKDNQLAWHIPADLQHFKSLTAGGVIVMGRKTFDSLGRLLPNRTHHVITRDKAWAHEGVTVSHELMQAIERAKADAQRLGQDSIFIIGGGEIYRQSIELAEVLEITHVDLDVGGDAFYPAVPEDFAVAKCSEEFTEAKSGVKFRFVRYERHEAKNINND